MSAILSPVGGNLIKKIPVTKVEQNVVETTFEVYKEVRGNEVKEVLK